MTIRVHDRLKNLNFNNTTEFGCLQKFDYKRKKFQHIIWKWLIESINCPNILTAAKIRTYFASGGGNFGANIHFLLQNFPNIKKIILFG